ncbi:hypothetical protein [Rhizobium laguerreae]|uniref:hypothetical protein n=1 Tax=Rhizobium laguerreae TaxID=1076926 RepID=UPI0021B1323B|nr:hypothetical protein [Rhizobium laguerreae]
MKQHLLIPLLTYRDATSEFMIVNAVALAHQMQATLTVCAVEIAIPADVRTRELKTTEPFVVEVLAEASRAYDLVLLEAAGISRLIVEAVLFVSGRPLILYPSAPFDGRIDHAAIAWDGSRAAARAAHSASFLLERTSKVCLLSVIDEKPVKFESGVSRRESAEERRNGGGDTRTWRGEPV